MKTTRLMLIALGSFQVLNANAASPPVISAGPSSITEGDAGNSVMVFPIYLSLPTALPVSFTYGTINGSALAPADYDTKGGIMALPAGTTNGSILIRAKSDMTPEGDEFFFIILSSPTNATFETNLIIGTIRDDDFRLMNPSRSGSMLHLSFLSVSNREHRVERARGLGASALWEPLLGATSITGDGNVIAVIDPAAEVELQKFYRVQLMPAKTTNLTISYVGSTPLGDYRTTAASKPLDPDGNAVFGSAGYVMYATDVIGSGNSGTTVIVNPLTYASGNRRTRLSLPSWLTLQNNGQDRIAASYSSYPGIDDPALIPGPSVADVRLGYAVPLAAYDTEATMLDIRFGNGAPAGGVRMGVACPATGLDTIEMIRVTYKAQATATALRAGATSHSLYLFDIIGIQPGDLVTLLLRKSSATGGNQNVAYAGLTFDPLPDMLWDSLRDE
jgi:hypothetical protein